jgi:hypothetical protein
MQKDREREAAQTKEIRVQVDPNLPPRIRTMIEKNVELARAQNAWVTRVDEEETRIILELARNMNNVSKILRKNLFAVNLEYKPIELLQKINDQLKELNKTLLEIGDQIGYVCSTPRAYRTDEISQAYKDKMNEKREQRKKGKKEAERQADAGKIIMPKIAKEAVAVAG